MLTGWNLEKERNNGTLQRGGATYGGQRPRADRAGPVGVTHEGAPGYARDAKSELFLLAVAHLADATFYESSPERDQRFTALVRAVTARTHAGRRGSCRGFGTARACGPPRW